jgi:hypothetical protein
MLNYCISGNWITVTGTRGWLISLWLYKDNNKLWDWKNVFTLNIPLWAPHAYDFVILTSLTHPRKILLVVLQTTCRWNRKSQGLVNTPTYVAHMEKTEMLAVLWSGIKMKRGFCKCGNEPFVSLQNRINTLILTQFCEVRSKCMCIFHFQERIRRSKLWQPQRWWCSWSYCNVMFLQNVNSELFSLVFTVSKAGTWTHRLWGSSISALLLWFS